MAVIRVMDTIFCISKPAVGAQLLPSLSSQARVAIAATSSPSSSLPANLAHRSIHEPPALMNSSPPTPFKARPSSIMRLPSPTDLSSLKLPFLHCSFPALVHADYSVVKEPCDAWIETVAEPPSTSASTFLHDCLLPLLVCQFIPKTISRQRLVHVIKTIAWLMVADDDDDHPDVLGSDSATTSHRADLVMAILRGEVDEESSFDCSFLTNIRPGLASKSTRMLKALAELWHEIREEMSASLQARFITTMADYFEGLKVQASFREKVIIPNVEQYMEIRRKASFTIPCFILMEYALGIELDNATFYNPMIQELHNVVLDYISLCNDVVSCRIEIQMGDYFNLPSILYNYEESQSRVTSFQSVMDHVAHMVQDLNNRAIFLISIIHEESKNFEPLMVPFIHAYVDGLSLCMSGALAWFFETARYQQASSRNELHRIPLKEMCTRTLLE